jgi:hypothetical protein
VARHVLAGGPLAAARSISRKAAILAAALSIVVAPSATAATPPTPFALEDGLGYYHPVSPQRVKDTRTGAPIGQQASIQVTVSGVAGVPGTAVAVVVNVTAVKPTKGTYLTVYPNGEPRPTASNLNVPAGATIANLVVAKIGTNGKIKIYNNSGNTDVVVDIAGWYDDVLRPFPGPHANGARFTPISPFRARDTRTTATPIGPGQSFAVDVTGVGTVGGKVPASGVRAVVVNITAVSPTRGTFLTAYPDGEARPLASNLNAPAGKNVPNLAIVKVGANGNIRIYNNSGSTHVIVDIAGWYGAHSTTLGGGEFTANSPFRVADTRPGSPIGPKSTATLTIGGAADVPKSGAAAVVLNLTAVKPTRSTYLTVHPSGEPRPVASNLNVAAGETRPNLVVVKVGADGKIKIYNNSGSVDVVVDVLGWYVRDGETADTPFDSAGGPPFGTVSLAGEPEGRSLAPDALPAASFANPMSPEETAGFWTADRISEIMGQAVPMALPERGPSGLQPSAVGSGEELWLHDHGYFDEGDQHLPVGRIIFRIPLNHTDIRGEAVPAGYYSCSGTLVARNVVLTAAHCVVSRAQSGENIWFDQFLFIPGQYAGTAPRGNWTSWLNSWAPGDEDGPWFTWVTNGEDGEVGNFWPADYAFLEFGTQSGDYPGDVAGYLPMDIPPWGTWVQDVGYPAGGGYSTYCTKAGSPTNVCYPFMTWSYFQEYFEHQDGWFEVGLGSWMTGGSSGGPMLSMQGETFYVSSVNSNGLSVFIDGVEWGYNMWGPWFNSITFDIYEAIAIP